MAVRRIKAAALALALALTLAGCGRKEPPPSPSPEPPPPVETGYRPTGRENPNMPKNEYDDEAFLSLGGFTIYTAGGASSRIGVDVSSHQGEIDWALVQEAGVEFAMVRAGFRGYTGGGIYQDDWFLTNMEGALEAGLKVGVYFFSQAVDPEEAAEEARTVLEWIEPYEVACPVVFDWEDIPNAQARTDDVEPETVTECVKAFCDTVKEAGYVPMVYFNRRQAYDVMDLEQLEGYDFWLASYGATPGFPYAFDMWQYSCTGRVPGIETDVDLDLYMTDFPAPPEPDAPAESERAEEPA